MQPSANAKALNVARIDRRARTTGRLGVKRGDRYALIPEEVMSSVSYGAQPDYAKCVLFALACRCNGHNNGDLSLPFSEARQLGIAHQWKLFAGLQLLRKAGLILCTRQGQLQRGTKLCSLYALTWRGIDAAPPGVAYDAGLGPCPIASNAWAKWDKPAQWLETIREVTRANHGRSKIPVSTTLGKGRSTTLGANATKTAQPRWGTESANTAPTVVDTSKTLGRGDHVNGAGLHATPPTALQGNSRRPARSNGHSQEDDAPARQERIRTALAHAELSNFADDKLAKITQTSVEEVRRARRTA
jgi:hypothetical protein